MATKKPAHKETTALAFVNGARTYLDAADMLLASVQSGAEPARLNDPVCLLYSHAVELALKGFLRSCGRKIRKKHAWKEPLNECLEEGLVLSYKLRMDMQNIVAGFESGNADQGFRYFTYGMRWYPDPAWMKAPVRALVEKIAKAVEERFPDDGKPKAMASLGIAFSIEPKGKKA